MATDPLHDRPLGHLLHRTAVVYRQAISRRLRDEQWLTQVGFRPPCVGALMHISNRQPVSQRQLSEEMGVDPSDVVPVVDILTKARFVAKERDPDDRRRLALSLTPLGRKAVIRLKRLFEGIDDEVLEPLSTSERAALQKLLSKVVAFHLGDVMPASQVADQAQSSVPAGARSS